MERHERFHLIDQMLQNGRVVSRKAFTERLEVSLATFKRDIEYLRDRMGAPIQWDRERGGYYYDPGAPRFSLPGLWFNASEIYALLTMQHLLHNLEPGLLSPHVAPLLGRMEKLLEDVRQPSREIHRRIRILRMAAREQALPHFSTVAQGLLERRRLQLKYYGRGSDEVTEREVSPQRLLHYRENWYLDAWCHLRKGLRSFAIDAIQSAQLLDEPCKEVDEKTLEKVLASSYGIFSGEATETARLRFTPERARWVSREQWHPEQKGSFDAKGYYSLEFPYHDDRELSMDILRHGPDVEVLGPVSLRLRIAELAKATRDIYSR